MRLFMPTACEDYCNQVRAWLYKAASIRRRHARLFFYELNEVPLDAECEAYCYSIAPIYTSIFTAT